jgi:hypothetical protein
MWPMITAVTTRKPNHNVPCEDGGNVQVNARTVVPWEGAVEKEDKAPSRR